MAKNILIFVAMLLVIAILTGVALSGANLVYFRIPSVTEGIKLGLDLRGGSVITFEARASEINNDTLKQDMESAIAMLRARLTSIYYTEANVYPVGDTRIRIEIPDVSNPEEAVKLMGSTAALEFRDSDGKVWLDGKAVEKAEAKYGATSQTGINQHYVELTFKKEYRDTWRDATKHAASQESGSNYIAIYLDDVEQFAPQVDAEYASTGIDSESCIVTFGTNTVNQAKNFAELVRIGQLPFSLDQVELRAVGPTLGERSLQTSLYAGAIGLGLIILFLTIFYRIPGVMASIALLFYTVVLVVILAILKVNLSLPGIAGIVLSLGMAVDANVIIFERLKDELRAGKTLKSAVESGFKRAMTAIIDSNLTTIIGAIVLMVFGTGSIQGFAVTLLTGVILSMFTSLFVTRMLLLQSINMGVTSIAAYGVGKMREIDPGKKPFSFVKNFNRFIIVSAVLCATGLIAVVLTPFGVNLFNFDIDFTGGTSFHIAIHKQLDDSDLNRITDIVRETSGTEPSAPQITGDGSEVIIKTASMPSETRDNVFNAIRDEYNLANEDRLNVEDVGAAVGSDLRNSAVVSMVVASFLILLYITFRFQFSSGVAAVAALVHDLLVVMSFYVISRMLINMNFVAVMLTILGYSINATIIIFDRVRENKRVMQKTAFDDVVDISIKETLTRTINTTITTLFSLVMIIILGVPSVRNFAIPLTVGMLAGLYSSLCISGGLWTKIRATDARKKKV